MRTIDEFLTAFDAILHTEGIQTLTLARLLPEKTVKNLLVGRLTRLISLPAAKRAGWLEAIHAVSRRSVSGSTCETRGATVTSP